MYKTQLKNVVDDILPDCKYLEVVVVTQIPKPVKNEQKVSGSP